MSPDIAARAPRDRSRINLEHDWEVLWWSAQFKVTPEQLRAAAQEAGPSPEEVERRLANAAKVSWKSGGED